MNESDYLLNMSRRCFRILRECCETETSAGVRDEIAAVAQALLARAHALAKLTDSTLENSEAETLFAADCPTRH